MENKEGEEEDEGEHTGVSYGALRGQYQANVLHIVQQMAGRVPVLVMVMKMGSGWTFVTRRMKTQEKW